jgi:hypothetical protein
MPENRELFEKAYEGIDILVEDLSTGNQEANNLLSIASPLLTKAVDMHKSIGGCIFTIAVLEDWIRSLKKELGTVE